MPSTIKSFFGIALLLNLLIISCAYGDDYVAISHKIKQAMQSECDRQKFSGVVLVAIDDRVIFKNVCGLANREFGVANKMDTKFNLGSVGKLFTSVAIAQLVQKDKLTLSTSLNSIIPSWLPKFENSKAITIEQLLIHASGLGTYMDDKRWQLGSDSGLYVNVDDYKPLIKDDKFLFSPGKNQSYSNNGYLLAGAVIEAITKKSYADYLSTCIFKPAGMKNTGVWSLDEIIPNRAEGYFKSCIKDKCTWKNNNYEAPFIGSPAGGAYSTAEDLFKFSQSLHHSKLLSTQFSRQILSTDIDNVSENTKMIQYDIYGLQVPEKFSPFGFAGAWNKYGFAVWENPFLVGHTGGIQGASAFFATSPDGKYTIILLANMSSSGTIRLYKNIRDILGFSGEIINY